MKTCLFFFMSLVLFLIGNAQENQVKSIVEGKVIYEEIIKLNIPTDKIPIEALALIPKERKTRSELLFNPEVSLYQPVKEEEKAQDTNQGGVVMKMNVTGGNNISYFDIKNQTLTEQREFMTRKFLIETKVVQPDWKLTGKQQTVLGYSCQEAELTENGRVIKVLFTPQIPVSTGPDSKGLLPGLILALDYNNGERTINALSIDSDVKTDMLTKPSEGKKVSGEEFKKIMEEKRKEMQMQNGGSNVNVRVIRN